MVTNSVAGHQKEVETLGSPGNVGMRRKGTGVEELEKKNILNQVALKLPPRCGFYFGC